MILWTVEAVKKAVKSVCVATDDRRIFDTVTQAGYCATMTGEALTGTDRVAQAAAKVDAEIYVNVQGDEPLVNPEDIRRIAEAKKATPKEVVTGVHKLTTRPKSIVLAGLSESGRVLYMWRETKRTNWKHVGIYAYNAAELAAFVSRGQKTEMEAIEDAEINRFLELDIPVRAVEVSGSPFSVDTPEDIATVEALLGSV